MRRWIAALAFVPALAWGDCLSHEVRETFVSTALEIQAALDRGVSPSRLLEPAQRIEHAGIRAATYEGVLQLSSASPLSLSAVVAAMQLECHDATTR
jgi:hypothetical protein